LGLIAIHSLIKEVVAVFPVPESPIRIVKLFVKVKSTIKEV
jgi:hypothetical protein